VSRRDQRFLAVVAEVEGLFSFKPSQAWPEDLKELPRTPRIREAARMRGIDLESAPWQLMVVFRALLDDLERREREELGALDPPHSPLARPARRLLGLTPGSRNAPIGVRTRLAAPERGVGFHTMRTRHRREVAQELAAYVLESPESTDEDTPSLDSPNPVMRLLVVTSYYINIIAGSLFSDWRVESVGEDDRFMTLFYLSNKDVRRAEIMRPAMEAPTPWLALVLDVCDQIMWRLPRFTMRQQEALSAAHDSSHDNFHAFLTALEADRTGRSALDHWDEWYRCTCSADLVSKDCEPCQIVRLAMIFDWRLLKFWDKAEPADLDYLLTLVQARSGKPSEWFEEYYLAAA
jgi:hypothetical protein